MNQNIQKILVLIAISLAHESTLGMDKQPTRKGLRVTRAMEQHARNIGVTFISPFYKKGPDVDGDQEEVMDFDDFSDNEAEKQAKEKDLTSEDTQHFPPWVLYNAPQPSAEHKKVLEAFSRIQARAAGKVTQDEEVKDERR